MSRVNIVFFLILGSVIINVTYGQNYSKPKTEPYLINVKKYSFYCDGKFIPIISYNHQNKFVFEEEVVVDSIPKKRYFDIVNRNYGDSSFYNLKYGFNTIIDTVYCHFGLTIPPNNKCQNNSTTTNLSLGKMNVLVGVESRIIKMFKYSEFFNKASIQIVDSLKKDESIIRITYFKKNSLEVDIVEIKLIHNSAWVFYRSFCPDRLGQPLLVVKDSASINKRDFKRITSKMSLFQQNLPNCFIVDSLCSDVTAEFCLEFSDQFLYRYYIDSEILCENGKYVFNNKKNIIFDIYNFVRYYLIPKYWE